jgi:hypothetical protein
MIYKSGERCATAGQVLVRKELAARRAATLAIIEQKLLQTREHTHPFAIIDGDHGDHPVISQ